MFNVQEHYRSGAVIELFDPISTAGDLSSWFGAVRIQGEGETWPMFCEQPMQPFFQINVAELAQRQVVLEDTAYLVMYIGQQFPSIMSENGNGWLIRAYRKGQILVPTVKPIELVSNMIPKQMRFKEFTDDCPTLFDLPDDVPEYIQETYYDLAIHYEHSKIGGWPSLCEPELNWPIDRMQGHPRFISHPAAPEYVMQICAEPKANWKWGHNGVIHIGCGTKRGPREWAIAAQSY